MDTEKFIKCVKNNPTIWQKSSANYGDRLMRESCWNIIGHQMFENWEEMTEKERREEVINMKNKWRHVRDSFNKYNNQVKSRYSEVKKRRYIYADNLMFLVHEGHKRTKNPVVQETNSKDSPDDQMETKQEESERTRPKPQWTKKTTGRIPDKIQTNKQSILKHTCVNSRSEEDPDRCYLLSLLPEFKKLTDDQKLDFRFHTLQFFRVVRSKRIRRSEINVWNDSMECDIDNPVVGNHTQVQPSSPSQSQIAVQDSSFPNSPQESSESRQSVPSPRPSSPHFENVKMEIF